MAQRHREKPKIPDADLLGGWRGPGKLSGSILGKDVAACREEFETWARNEGVPTMWFERDSAGDYIWGYMPQWWALWKDRHCPDEAAAMLSLAPPPQVRLRRTVRYIGDQALRLPALPFK